MRIIDGLSMPVAERKWLEEYHEAKLSAVNTTLCVWENAPEALAVIAKWRLLLEECKDIAAQATCVAEIESVAASGRTAIVFGFQNTAPVEHNLDLFGTFRDLGACIMQLTYNLQNYIGCGYWEANDSGISSRFGKLALEEMARPRAGAFLFGDAPTIADVCLVPQLYNARRFSVPLTDYPTLRRADETASAHAAFADAHPDRQEH